MVIYPAFSLLMSEHIVPFSHHPGQHSACLSNLPDQQIHERASGSPALFVCLPQVAREGPFELFDALPGYGGNLVELQFPPLDMSAELLQLFGVGAVNLGGCHNHRLVRQGIVWLGRIVGVVGEGVGVVQTGAAGEASQLVVDNPKVFNGIGAARSVAHVDQVE